MYDIYSLGRLTAAMILFYTIYFIELGFYQKFASYCALFGLFLWQFSLFVVTLEEEMKAE